MSKWVVVFICACCVLGGVLAGIGYHALLARGVPPVTQLLPLKSLLSDNQNVPIWLPSGTYYFALYLPMSESCDACGAVAFTLKAFAQRESAEAGPALFEGQATASFSPLPEPSDIWLSFDWASETEIENSITLPHPWTFATFWKRSALMPYHFHGLMRLTKPTRLRVELTMGNPACQTCMVGQGGFVGAHSYMNAI